MSVGASLSTDAMPTGALPVKFADRSVMIPRLLIGRVMIGCDLTGRDLVRLVLTGRVVPGRGPM